MAKECSGATCMQTIKKKIDAVIVVEGKNDAFKLRQVFEADIICTQGLGMPENVLKDIVEISKHKELIICTDPDGPGNRIRRTISELVPSAKHVYLQTKDAIGKRNVGIEYVDNDIIIEAFNHIVEGSIKKETLSWDEYIDLGLTGLGSNTKRSEVAEKLHIGQANAKTFFQRLNMIEATKEELERILNDV